MSGFSDARETIRATFIKLYLKKPGANTINPSWTDMLRGLTGWPHPRAEGHFKSYPLVPFELVLNTLKTLLVFLPFAVSILLSKALATPLLNRSNTALKADSVNEKVLGALGGVASFFLFALSIPPAIAAWLGYSTTAISDSKELARVQVGSVASWFNYGLSVTIHMAILTFFWPAYVGFMGVKALTLCNEYLQLSAAYPDEVDAFWKNAIDFFSNDIKSGYANATNGVNHLFVNGHTGPAHTGVVYAVVPVTSANNHPATHYPAPVAMMPASQQHATESIAEPALTEKPEEQFTNR